MDKVGEVTLQRLHPATLAVVFVGIARKFLIPGLVVLVVGSWPGDMLIMVAALPAMGWALISYLHKGYALTDGDLYYREGLIGRSLRRIPLARIKTIETRRSLVHRPRHVVSKR